MTKIKLFFVLLFGFLLIGCMDPTITQLTIISSSDRTFTWNGHRFHVVLPSGASSSQETSTVNPGSDHIYYTFGGDRHRTSAIITVQEGEHVTFTFTDQTVTIIDNPSTYLVISNQSSFDVNSVQWMGIRIGNTTISRNSEV